VASKKPTSNHSVYYSDNMSTASSKVCKSIYREVHTEEDQWANINKFNNLL